MVKAINIDAVSDFICSVDKDLPKEDQTTWRIGVIDSLTMSEISKMDVEFDAGSKEQKVKANIVGRELDFVRYGLKGWDNFKDHNGNEIKARFNTISKGGRTCQILHDTCLQAIPAKVIREIAKEIAKENDLSEVEEKNFE